MSCCLVLTSYHSLLNTTPLLCPYKTACVIILCMGTHVWGTAYTCTDFNGWRKRNNGWAVCQPHGHVLCQLTTLGQCNAMTARRNCIGNCVCLGTSGYFGADARGRRNGHTATYWPQISQFSLLYSILSFGKRTKSAYAVCDKAKR
jgi:hypothetical protein